MNLIEAISVLKARAGDLGRMTPTDAELADAIGDLRAVEVTLADIRHRWETLVHEMEPVEQHDRSRRISDSRFIGRPSAVGQRWEVVPQYETTRTFRSAAILAAVMRQLDDTGLRGTMPDALRVLRDADVVRIKWMWSNLEKFCEVHGIDLSVQDSEVEDDDDPTGAMVGAVRVAKGVTRVPIKEES